MPIVPTVTSSATFTLGQTLSVITLERSGQVTTQTISEYTIYNAAPYSHDKVFVTPANDNLVNTLPAQLTKRYTYTSGCTDRWMLAGQQDLIRAFAHLTTATTKTIFFGEAVPKSIYVPPKLTVFSMSLHGTATDPDYARCQPYSVAAAIYSPGVCPDGLTMAEVTAYQEVASTGSRTFWQGSCCQSGMTFGSEYPEACISTVSTPVTVRALVTDSRAPANPVYEYEYTTYVSSLTGYVTSTNSSKTMITTALAIADPVKVAWQTEDYKSFPSDYVSSLAGRFALSIPSPTPPGKNETPQSSGLSGGARIGIGLGAAAAALALLIGIVMLILKRRRRSEARTDDSPRPIAEMADQDHDLAKKKWWIGGRWRSEAQTHVDPQEMENKTVYVVPGPPAELDGAELSHPLESGRPVLRE